MANEDWDDAVRRIEMAKEARQGHLDISGMKISRLPDNIREMVNLEFLFLTGSEILDLALIANSSQLAYLNLNSTPIRDFSLLNGLNGLRTLFLVRTAFADLSDIANLESLEALDLRGSRVNDLRQILNIPINTGGHFGLKFDDTPACADPAIAAASKIENEEERLKTLRAHLRTLPPWPEPLNKRKATTLGSRAPEAAIQAAQTQIAFLIEHAAISQVSAATIADQIRFALRDVPARDGNRLSPILQILAHVATVFERIETTISGTDRTLELTRQIGELEAQVEALTIQLNDAGAARMAAEDLAKSDSFIALYKRQLATGSANLTVVAATAVIGVGIPTAAHYFLGADHPLVRSLFKAMRIKS